MGDTAAGTPARAVLRWPLHYVRSGPVTTTYLVVLIALHPWLDRRRDLDVIVAWLSTNLENLRHHPVGSLVGSGFVVNGPLTPFAPGFDGTLITLVLGIGVALWWVEARAGTRWAAGVLVAGHVGATLLTAVVILAAIGSGRYPPDTATATDVGISYGAQAALGAATVLLPWWVRPAWVVFVVAWPLSDADWFGVLPDFTTVGHLLSAAIGGALGLLWLRSRRR